MQSKKERNKVLSSLWTARIIPWMLVGVVGYATYVLVALLSVNYLLKKHHNYGAAIPILAVYFILLIFMAASFLRLLYMITFDPPYTPLGWSAPPAHRDRMNYKTDSKASHLENGIAMGEYDIGYLPGEISTEPKGRDDPNSPGLELFYTKDVFTCEVDGRPSWCSSCANWKPDRTHHCSSTGRCIKRMDHFCPWVGGPVGENNFKFFIQFNGYSALYCIHLLVVMAIYIRQQITTEGEELNRHFAAILALAGMFVLFTGGMFGTCLDLTMNNLTQIEKLGSRNKAYQLAVLKPPSKELHPQESCLLPYHEITYPLENGQDPHSRYQDPTTLNLPQSSQHNTLQPCQPYQETSSGSTRLPSSGPLSELSSAPENATSETVSSLAGHPNNLPLGAQEPNLVQSAQPETSVGALQEHTSNSPMRRTEVMSSRDMMATRTFAVLAMEPGENPWDLGSPFLNLETVMGTNLFDYILPIKRSPCCNHENAESYYNLGPALDRVKAKYNFISARYMRAKVVVGILDSL